MQHQLPGVNPDNHVPPSKQPGLATSQHFDVLSSYTEGIISSKKVEHSNDSGVINDLLCGNWKSR